MINTIVITAVLAFLLGMAVGIAGYCFSTMVAWEKEIETIFENMCLKDERKLARKEAENRRLSDSLVEMQVRLARKEKKNE